MSVESDFKAYLAVALPSASSCAVFVGGVRKTTPGRIEPPSIFVSEYGGLAPYHYMAGEARVMKPVTVQIRVQGAVQGYSRTKEIADNALNCFLKPNTTTLNYLSSGSRSYVFVRPMQSAPVYLGQNDTEQNQFSFNVYAAFEQG